MSDRFITGRTVLRIGVWMLVFALLALAAGLDLTPAVAQQAEGEPGDPGVVGIDEEQLPPGATRRIGSPRFRDGGEVRFLSYTPDGKRLLSIAGSVARLRELPGGKVVAEFPASDRWPVAAMSPDGRLLAAMRTPNGDQMVGGVIALYDAQSGALLHELSADDGTYTAMTFSADGKTLFAGAVGGEVRLIDCATGKAGATLALPDTRPPRPVAPPSSVGKDKAGASKDFSKDGGKAIADAKELQDRQSKDAPIKGVYYDPGSPRMPVSRIIHAADHDTLAVAHGAGAYGVSYPTSRVVLWDLKGDLKAAKPRFTGGVMSDYCELLLSGKTLTSVHPDIPGRSWDLTAGQTYEPDPPGTRQREHNRKSVRVVPSPSGKHFGVVVGERNIGGTGDKHKVVFHLTDATRTGGELLSLDHGDGVMAFSPDGSQAATASGDGVIRLWNAVDRKLVNTIINDGDAALAIAVSADGKRMATGGHDGAIRIHQLDAAKPVVILEGHTGAVVSLGFSPDGRSLASVSRDKTVKVWTLADGSVASQGKMEGYWNPEPSNLEWTDDARYFVFTGSRSAAVWDAVTVSLIKSPPAELVKQVTRNLRIRMNPREFSAGGDAGLAAARFFAPTVKSLSLNQNWSNACFAFDSGVTRAVCATGDVISLLDTATGNEVKRLFPVGPLEPRRTVKVFTHVGYSPDNRWIVAVQNSGFVDYNRRPPDSVGQVIRVFDAATGVQTLQLAGHRGAITAMTFSRDGKLHTGGEDGTVLSWDLAFRPAPRAVAGDPASLLKAVLGGDSESAQAAMAKAAGDETLARQIVDAYIAQTGGDAEIEARLNDLASEDFVTRFKALRELAALNDTNRPNVNHQRRVALQEQAFRYLLRDATPADAQRRARSLIGPGTGEQQQYPTPAQVRLDRVIKLLEWSGSPASQQRLAHFAARLPVGFGANKIEPALARVKAGTHRGDMPGAPPAITEPLTPEVAVKPVTPVTPPIPPVVPMPDPEPAPAAVSDLGLLKSSKPLPLPPGAAARFGDTRLRHGNRVQSVAILPDGFTLISSSLDETIRVWDLRTGAEVKRLPINHHNGASVVSPDGKYVAFTPPAANYGLTHDGKVKADIYETATWTKIATVPLVAGVDSQFSPDGSVLLLGSTLVETATGKTLFQQAGDLALGRVAIDARTVATLHTATDPPKTPGARGQPALLLRVWDVEKNAVRFESRVSYERPREFPDRDWLAGSQVTPDGRTLVTVTGSGMLVRWNLAQSGAQLVDGSKTVGGNVRRAAFSPDLKTLAIEIGPAIHAYSTYAETSKLLLASPTTLQSVKLLRTGQVLHSLDVSRDGKLIAGGGDDATVHLFDARTGQRLNDPDSGLTVIMKMSADGNTLALGMADGTIVLRKTADGSVIRRIPAAGARLMHLAFKPGDDKVLGASYQDNTVRSWDVTTGRSAGSIESENIRSAEPVMAPAWEPDGKLSRGYQPTSWWLLMPGYSNTPIYGVSDDGRLMGTGNVISLMPKERMNRPGEYRPGESRGTALMTLKSTSAPAAAGQPASLGYGASGFARDNRFYALGTSVPNRKPGETIERAVFVWNLETEKEIASFRGHEGVITAAVFSPKSDLLYTASFDGTVLVWKVPAK